MKKIFYLLTLIFTISTGIFGQTNGTVNIQKGQQFIVENSIKTISSTEMQGQSMETNIDVSTTYNIDVTDNRDNLYYMNNKIAAVKMNMTMMGQEMNFDSGKEEDMNGQVGSSLKGIINKLYPVVMDQSGNIILNKDSTLNTENGGPTQSEIMLKQIGDPALQGYGAKMAFIAIPPNAAVNSSWQDSSSDDGTVKKTNYIIKEIKDNQATISFSGTEDRDAKMEMQGMEISTVTKGTFSGEEIVDMATGIVLQSNFSADASGIVTAMGQEIPTVIKSTSVTTIKLL